MEPPVRTVSGPRAESVIADLAGDTHGVVTRAALLDAGLSREQVRKRVKHGALIRVHRGVYSVGHVAPSREATYMAAVLACGTDALLAGLAAAHLWGLIRGTAPAPEVISPKEKKLNGIRVHRERGLDRRDAGQRLGIPVTTVPRTLVDLAAYLPASSLARACHEAGVKYETTPRMVDRILERRPNSKGAAALRKVLHGDEPVTLSRLESRFLERLRDSGLPLPETNRLASGRRVDCRWSEHRLTIELDSYRFHSSRHAWERDRAREREARARGDEFRRFSYGDVFEQPGQMLEELAALLPSGRAPTRPAGCESPGPSHLAPAWDRPPSRRSGRP